MKQLITKKSTGFIDGLKGKLGKTFKAKLYFKPDLTIGLKFADNK